MRMKLSLRLALPECSRAAMSLSHCAYIGPISILCRWLVVGQIYFVLLQESTFLGFYVNERLTFSSKVQAQATHRSGWTRDSGCAGTSGVGFALAVVLFGRLLGRWLLPFVDVNWFDLIFLKSLLSRSLWPPDRHLLICEHS